MLFFKQSPGDRPDPNEGKSREEEIDCPFCSYRFPAAAGRYGCPNCEGEELE